MTGSVADAPGDVLVVSSECRDIDRGTLDSIQTCQVDPRSESKVCCGPSRSIIFDDGFFVLDLCIPGMMCKLDCPWFSLFLFVSISNWLFTSREQAGLANIRRYRWDLGVTHSAVSRRLCVKILCRNLALY